MCCQSKQTNLIQVPCLIQTEQTPQMDCCCTMVTELQKIYSEQMRFSDNTVSKYNINQTSDPPHVEQEHTYAFSTVSLFCFMCRSSGQEEGRLYCCFQTWMMKLSQSLWLKFSSSWLGWNWDAELVHAPMQRFTPNFNSVTSSCMQHSVWWGLTVSGHWQAEWVLGGYLGDLKSLVIPYCSGAWPHFLRPSWRTGAQVTLSPWELREVECCEEAPHGCPLCAPQSFGEGMGVESWSPKWAADCFWTSACTGMGDLQCLWGWAHHRSLWSGWRHDEIPQCCVLDHQAQG